MNFARKKIVALVLAGILAVMPICSLGENNVAKAYDDALNDMIQGKYAEAADILSGISFYEDSVQLAQYCRAHALAAEGKFEDAISILYDLGSYRDSSACVLYFQAREAEETAESPIARSSAAKQYEAKGVKGFRDSSVRAEKIRSALYQEGVAAEKSENWIPAANDFSALSDYQDSAIRCAYCSGRYCETADVADPLNYVHAVFFFEDAGDYSDSINRKQQNLDAALKEAEKLIEAEDFDGAEAIYLALGKYCDDSRKEALGKAREEAAERIRQEKLAAADALLENGRYDEAVKAYEELGEEEKVNEALYRKADAFEKDGKLTEAAGIFLSVSAYRDSQDRHYQIGLNLKETDPEKASRILLDDPKYRDAEDQLYDIAVKASEQNEYSLAISLYSYLGSTRDCMIRMTKDLYLYGMQLLEQEQNDRAASVFNSLNGIGSADLYANMARYAAAGKLEEAGNYETAANAFDRLGDYSDAKDRALNCRWLLGKQLMEAASYQKASEVFSGLGELNDSVALEKECRYLLAGEYEDNRQWEQAITLYTALKDYSDSGVKCKACYSALGEEQLAGGRAESAYQSFVAGEDKDGQARAAFAVAEEKTAVMNLQDALGWYKLAAELPETEARTAMLAESLLYIEEDELSEQYASVIKDSDKNRETLYALAIRSLERQDEDAAIRQMQKAGDNSEVSEQFREMLYSRVSTLVAEGEYDKAADLCASFGDQERADSLLKEKADKEEEERVKAEEEKRKKVKARIKEGDDLLAAGDYDGAIAVYRELEDWQLVNEAIYRKAAGLDQPDLYMEIIDYKDSREKHYLAGIALTESDPDRAYQILAQDVDYPGAQAALYMLADRESGKGNYALSSAVFMLLSNQPLDPENLRPDCIMRAIQDIYQYGLALKEKGDYELAVENFNQVSGLSLAQEHINESYYAIADALEKKGDYSQSAVAFEALGAYSDAAERARANRYAAAMQQMENGQYALAEKGFTDLDGYKDSNHQIKECQYMAALEQLVAGKYEDARKAFEALGKYRDSETKKQECFYQIGCMYLDNHEYENALSCFDQIKAYKDSANRKRDSRGALGDQAIQRADALLRAGNTGEAITVYETAYEHYNKAGLREKAEAAAFVTASCYQSHSELDKALEWYKKAGESGITRMMEIARYAVATEQYESAEAIQKLIDTAESRGLLYKIAEKKLANGDTEEAIRLFAKAADYSDAKDRYNELVYQKATALEEAHEYVAASEIYAGLPGYRDADERYKAVLYHYADELYNKNDLKKAYDIFVSLNGYLDSAAKVEALKSKRILVGNNLVKVGDVIEFGHYEQDNKKANGAETIEWIVLDYDKNQHKILVISKYGLDAKPYNKKYTGATWAECTLRKWLNKEFLQSAFSEKERAAILTTTVNNKQATGYSGWDTKGGKTTKDKIFLLSYAEAKKYFHVSLNGKNTDARVILTAYAKANGAMSGVSADSELVGWWWLRSPGVNQGSAANVDYLGTLYSSIVTGSGYVVRPAFWLNLEADAF